MLQDMLRWTLRVTEEDINCFKWTGGTIHLPSPKIPALEKEEDQEEKPGVACENVERIWWFGHGGLDDNSGSLWVKGFVGCKTGIIVLWDVMVRPS